MTAKADEGTSVFLNHKLEHISDVFDLPLDDFIILLRELPAVLIHGYAAVQTMRDMGETGRARELVPTISYTDSGEPGSGGVELVVSTGERIVLT